MPTVYDKEGTPISCNKDQVEQLTGKGGGFTKEPPKSKAKAAEKGDEESK